MSKLPGIAMVIAGVGVAAYALPWSAGVLISSDALEEIQAPKVILKVVESPSPKVVEPPSLPAWQATYKPSEAEPHSAPFPSKSAAPPKRVAVAEVPQRLPIAQGEWAVTPSSDRASLAREIQRHLKRVGCYEGDVTGVWSPSVRRAMKSFTERMNATLPVDEPDFVLLAMVENHGSQACGRPCGTGQSDTRCVPSTGMVASVKTLPPNAGPADKQAAVPSAAPEPLEGRMALAGPKTEGAVPGAFVVPMPTAPAGEVQKTASRVNKSRAAAQRPDRTRNRSAAGKSFPGWARSAFGL